MQRLETGCAMAKQEQEQDARAATRQKLRI